MSASDFFNALGMSDFTKGVDCGTRENDLVELGISFNGEYLVGNRMYTTSSESTSSVIVKINDLLVGEDDGIAWLSLTQDESHPSGIDSFYVNNLEVLKELILQLVEDKKLIFITPVSALTSTLTVGDRFYRLSECLEELRCWFQSEKISKTSLFLLDIETREGGSDSKRFIRRFTDHEL